MASDSLAQMGQLAFDVAWCLGKLGKILSTNSARGLDCLDFQEWKTFLRQMTRKTSEKFIENFQSFFFQNLERWVGPFSLSIKETWLFHYKYFRYFSLQLILLLIQFEKSFGLVKK